MKNTKYILLISLTVACGGLLFGFDTAVISGVLPILQTHFGLNELMSGWVVSILTVGCIAGSIFSSGLADKYGRKKLLFFAAAGFLVSSLGTAFSINIYMLQSFRFIGGLAVGVASVASPMYIAEISPAKERGKMVSINQLTIVSGILLAFFSNYLLVNTGENNWRWMLLVMGIPACVFFILLFFVPETPRWLISAGCMDESKNVLKKIRYADAVEQEFCEIQQSLNRLEEKSSLKSLLFSTSKYTLCIGIVLAILQQITGINTIMYYAPVIFDAIGFSANSALFQTILIGSINLLFTIISMFLIDKIGRKPLLLAGSGLMALALGILSFSTEQMGQSYGTLICILVYIAAYAISLGPVTWTLISEIFPNKYRGTGMSVSTMFLWTAAFLVALFFPSILTGLGISKTFLLFMIICAASFLFYLFCIKETKNTKLEDVI
jgi:sugar porter (SP) family MFS transporter